MLTGFPATPNRFLTPVLTSSNSSCSVSIIMLKPSNNFTYLIRAGHVNPHIKTACGHFPACQGQFAEMAKQNYFYKHIRKPTDHYTGNYAPESKPYLHPGLKLDKKHCIDGKNKPHCNAKYHHAKL